MMILDTSGTESQILCEIAASQVSVQYNEASMCLFVRLREPAMKAFLQLRKKVSDVDAEMPALPQSRQVEALLNKSFTAFSFPNGNKGRQNMKHYSSVMRYRFETLRGLALVTEAGKTSIPGEMWADILAKGPEYLTSLCKSKPEFSTTVFLKLRDAVPVEANGLKKFQALLRDIVQSGPAVLPGLV